MEQLGLQLCTWTRSPQRCMQGSLHPACRRRAAALGVPPRLQRVLLGLCRSCRRARSAWPAGTPPEAWHKLSCCRQSAGARRTFQHRKQPQACHRHAWDTVRVAGGSRRRSSSRSGACWSGSLLPGCGGRSDGPVRPFHCYQYYNSVNMFCLLLVHRRGVDTCASHSSEHWLSAGLVCWWLYQHPLAAAGTPEEASARRWLKVQGSSTMSIDLLSTGGDTEEDAPGCDPGAERLSTLLASLPALTSIKRLYLRADPHRTPTAAAVRAYLARAARAIARCSGLRALHAHIALLGGLGDQVPEALLRELASLRALEEVTLRFGASEADRPDRPAAFSLAHLVAGLAGLPQLRALSLSLGSVCFNATLPASVSRLAQLTHLCLTGVRNLRCEPGWARLPALARLQFRICNFAGDGEAALPGMDALAALTSLELQCCPSLRLLPTSLWRLSQLRCLSHQAHMWDDAAGVPRSALPVLGLPLSAPCFMSLTHLALAGHNLRMPQGGAPGCFASLTHLTLAGHNLRAFPPCILVATRLQCLDLSDCCFGQLPEGVSALTGLEALHLGWPSPGGVAMEVGGSTDARALGSLASFPHLRGLSFTNCSVLFSSDLQAAAAHARLEFLSLTTAYPETGPSCVALLGFVCALLQRGRARAFFLAASRVRGAGRRSSCNFRAGLEAVGYPLRVDRRVVYRDDDESMEDSDDTDDLDGDACFSDEESCDEE